MATAESHSVEHIYMNVLNEIAKALRAGDTDRAEAMATSGALGKPRVFPALNTEGSN